MYFIYTIDEYANEPVMLIDKHIGVIDGEMGIMGDQFTRELIALDGMGKKCINVWINSIGGVVYDAMSIFNAISKCKTKVNTHNVGIAASAAGLIFQAGNKRYMNDYALLMIHSPFNPDGEEDEALSKFKDSCVTMLMNKCKKTREEVEEMMNGETWLSSDECMEMGFCDEVGEAAEEIDLTGIQGVTNKWQAAAKFLNTAIDKTKNSLKMNKVLNFLQLQDAANEDAILNAIQTIKNEATEAKAELEALKAEKANLETKIAEHEAKELEAQEAAKTTAATELVNTFKARLGEKQDVITKWVNLAKSDFEGTKELLEALPLNVVAPKIEDVQPVQTYNMAAEMAKRAQLNNNK